MTWSSSSSWPLLRSKPTEMRIGDQELSNDVFISTRRAPGENPCLRLTKLTVATKGMCLWVWQIDKWGKNSNLSCQHTNETRPHNQQQAQYQSQQPTMNIKIDRMRKQYNSERVEPLYRIRQSQHYIRATLPSPSKMFPGSCCCRGDNLCTSVSAVVMTESMLRSETTVNTRWARKHEGHVRVHSFPLVFCPLSTIHPMQVKHEPKVVCFRYVPFCSCCANQHNDLRKMWASYNDRSVSTVHSFRA